MKPLSFPLILSALALLMASCSSVDTLRTQLQQGELRGTIAVTKPVSYSPEHPVLEQQGGAFPVYFSQALAKERRVLKAVVLDAELPADAPAHQAQKLGRQAGAEWLLQPVLIGDQTDVRRHVDHFVDYYPTFHRGRRWRYRPYFYYPHHHRNLATTSTVRSASLALKLYRVADGAEVWLGQGTDSVSNSVSEGSWGGFVRLPAAPASPDLAEALAEMAADSAKELSKFAPKAP